MPFALMIERHFLKLQIRFICLTLQELVIHSRRGEPTLLGLSPRKSCHASGSVHLAFGPMLFALKQGPAVIVFLH